MGELSFSLPTPCRSGNDVYRLLAGQSGRFAFAECQAHVQTPPNIENSEFNPRVRMA